MTSPFADDSRSWEFLSGLGAVWQIKLPTIHRLLLFKLIVDGLYIPVFQYIAEVDFVQQFVQTTSAKHVMLNSP